MSYGVIGHPYERREGFGVFEAISGDFYFFWMTLNQFFAIKEGGFTYLAQVKSIVTTPSMVYNRNPDLLSREQILRVLNPWISKVKNPEVLKRIA